MTSKMGPTLSRLPPKRRSACRPVLAAALSSLLAVPLLAAEAPYPFEGTWLGVEHACTPAATRTRTYTSKDVVSALGHCGIRRITSGSGSFELREECRRNDRPVNVTETIRMTSPDSMVLRRQFTRLKIPRPIRFARCTITAPAAPAQSAHPAKTPAGPETPRHVP